MSKQWLVALHEYRGTISQRGFLLGLLSVPVLTVVVGVIFWLLSLLSTGPAGPAVIGYIDHAGVLWDAALDLAESQSDLVIEWVAYDSDEAVDTALELGEIGAYFVLDADYPETGRVELVTAGEPSADSVREFRTFLQASLLSGKSAEVIQRAVEGSHRSVRSPDGQREFTDGLTLSHLLPAMAGLGFVVLIFVSSGYLTQAITAEKANRTIEILATSLSPWKLASGKILGIVGATLTQFASWAAFALAAAFVGGRFLGIEWLQTVRLEPSAVLLLTALLVPAYVLVAAVMTAVGAAVEDARGGQQVIAIFVGAYLVPVGLMTPAISAPNGPLAVGLSLFPLTAPIMMPLRSALVPVETWQVMASVSIEIVLAIGALWLAARSIRLGMMRYGKRLHWREFLGVEQGSAAEPHRDRIAQQSPPPTQTRGARNNPSKMLLILRHEFLTTVTRPLFLLVCAGLPVFVFTNLLVMNAMAPGQEQRGGGTNITSGISAAPTAVDTEMQGYVDQSGLILSIPADIPEGTLRAYPDEAGARQALSQGEISGFYVIPEDYLPSGELIRVRPDYNPLASGSQPDLMDQVLLFNLLEGDSALVAQVWNPMDLQIVTRAPTTGPDDESVFVMLLNQYLPPVISMLLYGAIAMTSGLLLQSVSTEKKNRVMEVLLLSVNPQQMLTGKIIALGAASLLQAAAWVAITYLLFAIGGRTISVPAGVELPPSLLVWGPVFFLLGYGLYASLFASAGALAPDFKEAPQASLVLFAPAFVGFQIGLTTVNNPHGLLPTVASLFPLTAPFSMINRLVAGGVPLWQLLLSAGLTLATTYLIIRAVAAMFHAQNLLSGQPFSVGRYIRTLMGQA